MRKVGFSVFLACERRLRVEEIFKVFLVMSSSRVSHEGIYRRRVGFWREGEERERGEGN